MSVTMRQMLEAGVHFGHQTRFWNPKMAPYIFGHRNKIHIVNLERTLENFQSAAKFVRQLTANRGTILFVGTKRQAREIVVEEATRAGQPYIDQRWLGGMLTNFKTIRQSIKRLMEIEDLRDTGALDRRNKKEAQMMRRELEKLHRSLGGIKEMNGLPDALFVVDVGHEQIAIAEAKKLGIPVVAVVDTNCSPEGVDYMVPGNDDAMKAILLYAAGIADAVIEGKDAVPQVPVGEDEFVELDEEGNVRRKSGPGRAAPRRPVAARRKPARPVRKPAAAAGPAADEASGPVAEDAAAAEAIDPVVAELAEQVEDKEEKEEAHKPARRRPAHKGKDEDAE